MTLEALDTQSDDAPLLYYRVCDTGHYDCNLTEEEGRGGAPMNVVRFSGDKRTSVMPHDPEDCPDPTQCTYLFAVSN